MKKKYMTYVLMAAMMVGNMGCTKQIAQTKDEKEVVVSTQEEQTEQTEASEETSAEDEKQEASQDAEKDDTQENKVKKPLKIRFTSMPDSNEEREKYITGFYPEITILGNDYPELKEALTGYFGEVKNTFYDTISQYVEDAKMQAEEMDGEFYPYTVEYSASVIRMDDNVTSILINEYTYLGGAHGGTFCYGVNFDSKTGKEIPFTDLGVTKDEMRNYIDGVIRTKREQGGDFSFYEDGVDTILEDPRWILNGAGLGIIFNQYDIASYAEGGLTVIIPFSELKNFNEKYLNAGNAFYSTMDSNIEMKVDIDGDNQPDAIELIENTDENNSCVLSIRLNDTYQQLDTCSYLVNTYFVSCENGRKFVIVGCDMMSGDYQSFLVEVTDGKLTEPKILPNMAINGMNGENMSTMGYISVLGTYLAKQEYSFSDGEFVPQEERFELDNYETSNRRGPVLKTALEVQLQTTDGLTATELPAGTRIYPVNTDDKSIVAFTLEDGTYGELSFEKKDGMVYINGVSDFDLFDELPYAG